MLDKIFTVALFLYPIKPPTRNKQSLADIFIYIALEFCDIFPGNLTSRSDDSAALDLLAKVAKCIFEAILVLWRRDNAHALARRNVQNYEHRNALSNLAGRSMRSRIPPEV